MMLGTLSGVEMGLGLAGIPHQTGGVASHELSVYHQLRQAFFCPIRRTGNG